MQRIVGEQIHEQWLQAAQTLNGYLTKINRNVLERVLTIKMAGMAGAETMMICYRRINVTWPQPRQQPETFNDPLLHLAGKNNTKRQKNNNS